MGTRIAAGIVALALMLFSVGFSWAVVDDYSQREVVPKGATVEGLAVGGLPRAEAVALVRERIEKLLLAPTKASGNGKTYRIDSSRFLTVDVEGMVDATFAPQRQATLAERVYRRVTNGTVQVDVKRKLKIDGKALAAWAAKSAGEVKSLPVDSGLSVDGDRLRISKSKLGWELDQGKTVVALARALANGKHDVKLPLVKVPPKVTEKSFGRTILVHLDQTHLWLFNGEKLVKDYPIAVGTGGHPTPQGWWVVEAKDYMPTWTNPAPNGWGAGMPASIGPGYNNPLGTRALRLNASGVAIHGTSNDGSIGSAASHGCMRMHMWDVEELFDLVEAGDRVIIVP
jgi:hypothetical protein